MFLSYVDMAVFCFASMAIGYSGGLVMAACMLMKSDKP
jgi:hypothetical protein